MSILLFFIDGLGLGQPDAKINPLIKNMHFFNKTFGKHCFVNNGKLKEYKYGTVKGIDACLGVDGLPQSATGQTALFTGINAAKLLGYHLTAYPNTKLTKIIEEKSILKQLKDKNHKATSANAYSDRYFSLVEEGQLGHSASTLTILAAGIPFRMIKDLKTGNAVFMDITNKYLKQYSYKGVKKIHPKTAARNMNRIMNNHDFVLFEYWLTDYYGHLRGTKNDINRTLDNIDSFVEYIVRFMKEEHVVLITSDHGNIENISSKPHTKNPVPLAVFSKNNKAIDFFNSRINDITHVAPAIIEYIENNN